MKIICWLLGHEWSISIDIKDGVITFSGTCQRCWSDLEYDTLSTSYESNPIE